MRRTLIALLVVFVLAACGGDESKPADTDGQTPTGKGGGDIVTLKPPPPGQATPEKTPPPPEDPTIALEKLANSAFESDDMELALEAIDKILNGSGDKGKRARLLARALEYDDPDVRSTAVVAIGKMEVPTVAPNIRSLLSREKDALVRKEAVVSLFALVNKEAVNDLVAILENEDENYMVRAMAAQLLGRSGSELAVKPLMTALEESFNEAVRRESVVALGALKAKEAHDLLIDTLDDANALVRTEVAKALGEMKVKKAAGALIAALNLEEEEIQVLEAVSRALGKIAGFSEEDVADYLVTSNHSEAQQKAAVANWKEWWEENKAEYE